MAELNEQDIAPDPLEQFRLWFAAAQEAGVPEPEAMCVASATREGRPSARMVLLRGLDERGFMFYTNYESRKGQELLANPYAALVFFWPQLQRQVRIEGAVERATPEESAAYFGQRGRGHQIGAWASQQSQPLESRVILEARVQEVEERFAGQEVPLPPYWGGFRVVPSVIEFWQGRLNRLHDRLVYQRLDDGTWVVRRLYP